MTDVAPPRWAELILRSLLSPEDREAVAGDLLEEYRVTVVPARGEAAADAWYLRQVAGFAWRATWPWALAFSAAYIGRAALDWTHPPLDFQRRSLVTTILAVGLLTSVGARAAWRTGLVRSGAVAAVATAGLAALASVAGVALLLALRHDAFTWNAIAESGGLDEALTLPLGLIVPAAMVGVAAGAAGSVARRIVGGRSDRA